ncbi:hypothetical protein MUK70_10275 [Dyadobacter chenwenxiniae]|uniref:Uncharacterized protein n=1 Tax=Dyadobacter chenwenxiniae TaxID=2906456 RepID=A0A9X1PLV2_9BACT|nr:hypothetical protein [Dyadobacter chenwenxiniae]MCF0063248.1 hypothetical protein [Dyadobacter chenwenxiniae]UON85371.1 hypothetical protein MUK70_10275 [Dyadobacter chenwenxiniae]
MFKYKLLAALLLIIQGCAIHETPLEDANTVPESVHNLIYEKFPDARNLSSIVIEKNKVYEVTFKLNDDKYSVVANGKGIISTARTTGEAIPDSLVNRLNNTIIKGGTFSDYRIITLIDGYPPHPTVNYRLNGTDFVLTLAGSVFMAPYTKMILLWNLSDLPDKIVQFIDKRNKPNPAFVNTLVNLNQQTRDSLKVNNELSFRGAILYVNSDGTKTYEVNVSYFGATSQRLLFNGSGDLIWVSSFNAIRQYDQDLTKRNFDTNLTLKEMMTFTDILRASSHFFGFSLDVSDNLQNSFRNEYAGLTSYTLFLSNNSPDRWTLYYDANKKLIFPVYSAGW